MRRFEVLCPSLIIFIKAVNIEGTQHISDFFGQLLWYSQDSNTAWSRAITKRSLLSAHSAVINNQQQRCENFAEHYFCSARYGPTSNAAVGLVLALYWYGPSSNAAVGMVPAKLLLRNKMFALGKIYIIFSFKI